LQPAYPERKSSLANITTESIGATLLTTIWSEHVQPSLSHPGISTETMTESQSEPRGSFASQKMV
jgi:hypothetical protein